MGVSVRSQFIDERSTRLENNKAKGPEEHRGQTVSLRYKQENGHFRLESGKEAFKRAMAESKSRAYSSEAWHRLVRKMLKASVAVCGGVCPSECHRLGGLGDRNGLSHSSGGYTSKIKVSAGDAPLWAVRESLFLASLRASGGLECFLPWPCVFMLSSLCGCLSPYPNFSFFTRPPVILG